MGEAGNRALIVQSALEAAVTGDEARLEQVYTDDVTGWSPTATATSREDLLADLRGRRGVFSDVDLALDITPAERWKALQTHHEKQIQAGIEALDIEKEDPKVRARYGKGDPKPHGDAA